MSKINFFIILFFLLANCSVDTKSGLWKNKNSIKNEQKIFKISFSKELTFEEFKENVIIYSKKSNYPSIVGKNE